MIGLIIKGIAGFYYVKTGERIYQCKARGIFKKDGIIPYVGDDVVIEETDTLAGEAVIDKILPRRNFFIRPPIANVDCFVVVVAAGSPKPNLVILDKFLVMAEKARTEIVICLNKEDLDEDGSFQTILGIYGGLYPVIAVSGKTGRGLPELAAFLTEKKSALAGPSGVGKSTMLNILQGTEAAITGEVGHKSKRGKHTTKHVEIFDLPLGGMLYDTPGFTSFEVLEADEDELQFLYPEIVPLIGKCKYHNCRHLKEPGCAVREAAADGRIHELRYESYTSQCLEIQEKRKRYYD